MDEQKLGVLFVCMGNICRSPTAEALFRHKVEAAGLSAHFHIDSAGTHAYHVGHPPDTRSEKVAKAHGVSMEGQRARRVEDEDFTRFTHIIAMDRLNLVTLQEREPDDSTAIVSLLLSESENVDAEEVPDPYYGGTKGFDRVFDLVNSGCDEILSSLCQQHNLPIGGT